jgi:hypothetical protein
VHKAAASESSRSDLGDATENVVLMSFRLFIPIKLYHRSHQHHHLRLHTRKHTTLSSHFGSGKCHLLLSGNTGALVRLEGRGSVDWSSAIPPAGQRNILVMVPGCR